MYIIPLNKKLINKFKTIAKKLKKFDPENQQQLIETGIQLEDIKKEIPTDFTELIAFFIMCLDGLQGIYNNQISNPDDLIKTEADTIEKIADALKTGNNETIKLSITNAGHQMWIALGRNEEKSPYLPVTQKIKTNKKPELILNDVAALFLQLTPSDLDDLKRINLSLKKIENEPTLTTAILGNIKLVRNKITKIIENPNAYNETEFNDISKIIEQTLDFMEGNQTNQQDVDSPSGFSSKKSVEKTESENTEFHLPTDFDSDIIYEFIAESNEYLEDAESALLQLEKNPNDAEAINTVFRAFHTIKGTSGFLQLDLSTRFAHVAESFFSRIRDGEITCTGRNADLSLRSIDMVKLLVQSVEKALAGKPLCKPKGYDELIDVLSSQDEITEIVPEKEEQQNAEKEQVSKPEQSVENIKENPVSVKKPSPTVLEEDDSEDNSPSNLSDMITSAVIKDAFVRVRTERLDGLIEMVGELVIAQSMISQDEIVIDEIKDEFTRKVIHASKIVRDLQDLSLSMRMIPLSGTFQQMSRLVRDLSIKTGKKVDFIGHGEDTEIDRKMVELVKDPIVHMIRNSMDHGFESGEERKQKGKPAVGNLRMSAFHSGGNVIIKIEDDGRGLNREKILKKAVDLGIIDNGNSLSDNEINNLIFAPGFSTAEIVSDVSGRGVGLDVVRQNIEKLRGRIDIDSTPGKGCTFTLSFPLTIAIIDGMLVKIGSERYIIPIIDIQMSLKPDKDILFSVAQRGEMVMFQNTLIPIFRLHKLFHIKNAIEDPTQGLLVIIGSGERCCALLVDQLLGQQQVVTKALGEELSHIKAISGGAILGDGKVGLILDTSEISVLAKENEQSKINYNFAEKMFAGT